MDQLKVEAVMEWPRPEDRKQLQRFLGFANFYRRFIQNYSTGAAPLTALTSTTYCWTPDADQAFTELKQRFVLPPILTQPDPKRQFVLEVDASDTGIGAVWSQWAASDQKLHPCAERNYDVGDRELLAVKLALEEWRPLLEGSQQPFIVWTDLKNLEYIGFARRLNTRQACWSLFFCRFNFTVQIQEHRTGCPFSPVRLS